MMSEIFTRIFQGPGTLETKLQRFDALKNEYFNLISPKRVIDDFNLSLKADFGLEKFVFVPHHVAHIMTGFFVAGLQESAFLITDGRAEIYSSVMGTVNQERYEIFKESSIELANSIGILYANMTRYLGFTPNSDEYKVMALSAFAQNPPDYDFGHFIDFLPHGKFKLRTANNAGDIMAFYKFFDDFFGPQTPENANNAAYFMQTLTERAIAHQVKTLEQKTTANTLILDGSAGSFTLRGCPCRFCRQRLWGDDWRGLLSDLSTQTVCPAAADHALCGALLFQSGNSADAQSQRRARLFYGIGRRGVVGKAKSPAGFKGGWSTAPGRWATAASWPTRRLPI
jgi:carbamoyltransferase